MGARGDRQSDESPRVRWQIGISSDGWMDGEPRLHPPLGSGLCRSSPLSANMLHPKEGPSGVNGADTEHATRSRRHPQHPGVCFACSQSRISPPTPPGREVKVHQEPCMRVRRRRLRRRRRRPRGWKTETPVSAWLRAHRG
ncbi:unnamed protein product [Merluccius merluccius]